MGSSTVLETSGYQGKHDGNTLQKSASGNVTGKKRVSKENTEQRLQNVGKSFSRDLLKIIIR